MSLFFFFFFSFLFLFLSLSFFSVSVSCVAVCVSVCVSVCVVWCGTLKTPCVDSKRFPCVDSKRPRVCGQHAHTCFNMCARVASIHGDVLNLHTEAC